MTDDREARMFSFNDPRQSQGPNSVPRSSVGMPSPTLYVVWLAKDADAERPGRHSHAERGNECRAASQLCIGSLFSSVIDHRPSTIDHRPSAIGHRPSAIGHQPSAIGHRPSAIGHRPSAIGHADPVDYGQDMRPDARGLSRRPRREMQGARPGVPRKWAGGDAGTGLEWNETTSGAADPGLRCRTRAAATRAASGAAG
jgi:hypothetical protein